MGIHQSTSCEPLVDTLPQHYTADEIASLRNSFNQSQLGAAVLQTKNNTLQEQLDIALADDDSCAQQISNLQAKLVDTEEKLKQAQKEANELRTASTRKRMMIRELYAKNEEMKEELIHSKKETNELQRKLDCQLGYCISCGKKYLNDTNP